MAAEALEALVNGGAGEAGGAVVVAIRGAPNIRGAVEIAAEAFVAPNKKGAWGGAGGTESFSAPNRGAGGGADREAAEAFKAPNMKGA